MFTLKDIFNIAVQIENNGERVYRHISGNISNPKLIEILTWLADEEAAHAQWFNDLMGQAEKRIDDPGLEQMGKEILLDIIGDQSFSLEDIDPADLQDHETLLRLSVEFEKDTILFYEMLRPFVEDKETEKHLKEIIEEENRHVTALQEFLAAAARPPA